MNEFIISDTHFNHTNIIKYTNRINMFDIDDVVTMNNTIIKNWNAVVKPGDTVYHLGDFAFGSFEDICHFKNQLNGNIILIKGNHDRKSNTKFLEAGFIEVHKTLELNREGIDIILSHRPINDPGRVNIHGHIHSEEPDEDYNYEFCVNASIEAIDFKPIKIDELLKRYNFI